MSTYELLLLVGDQLGDFVLASCQLLFVVHKVTDHKLLFAGVQLELLDDLCAK